MLKKRKGGGLYFQPILCYNVNHVSKLFYGGKNGYMETEFSIGSYISRQ